jgi:hypothetical protein
MEYLNSIAWLELLKTWAIHFSEWFGYGIIILLTLFSMAGIASVSAGNKEENLPIIFIWTAASWSILLMLKL